MRASLKLIHSERRMGWGVLLGLIIAFMTSWCWASSDDSKETIASIRDSYNLNPNVFDEGYRLGIIQDAKVEGNFWPFKTLEGNLGLGLMSAKAPIVSQACMSKKQKQIKGKTRVERAAEHRDAVEECTISEDPWSFSSWSRKKLLNVLSGLDSGQMVMIHYISKSITFFTDTGNIILDAYPTDKNYPLSDPNLDVFDAYPFAKHFNHAKGIIKGYIVSASRRGRIRSTYELVVQQQGSTDSFISVSVSESKLFDHILECMYTGQPLKISYINLWGIEAVPEEFIWGYDTSLRAYKVEVMTPPAKDSSQTP